MNLDTIAICWIALGLVLFPVQLFVTAPYGRHGQNAPGPKIPNRFGWMLMEAVSLVVFAGLFLLGPTEKTAPTWVFFALWSGHYINRSLIYPWRIQTHGKTMPIAITASAAFFNLVNGGLNGLQLGWVGYSYPTAWLSDPRFIVGLAIFALGAAINIWSDNRLIALREQADDDYAIPRGGLFNWISCPNHFGEIVQWWGFALMCWNLPALSFAIWTTANLVPRALSHHQWYRREFPDYPRDRRAVVPGLL